MEISELDSAIKQAVEKIVWGVDTQKQSLFCEWVIAMRTRENDIFVDFSKNAPILIQYIEDTEQETTDRSGRIFKTIDFYFVNPRPEDTLETRAIHDLLNLFVIKFQRNLSEYYESSFIGQRVRLVDQLASVKEAGVYFQLQLKIDRPC